MTFLLSQSVDRSADRNPDSLAFKFAQQTLSYSDLVRQANCLAETLIEQGVKRHDRVGIFMHKCIQLPVCIYGTMKTGAAYVPLDPDAPRSRLDSMIADCGIRHILTEPSKHAVIAELCADGSAFECVIGLSAADELPIRCIEWADVFNLSGAQSPRVRVLEDDLAYIMYTSGSTGTPKGIMHTHRSGLAYAKLSSATYGLRPADRMANHAPLHSDMSTFEFLGGPFAGASVILIPEEYTKLPASLSKLVQDEALTVWYSVVSALIQMSTRGAMEQRELECLRWVLFCGEPMPAKSLRRLMELLPKARFSNSYGPAEVNQCTYYHVPQAPQDDEESVPIGRVWDITEGLVLGDDDGEVATGDIGELIIRSATMMRGYWNRPDLNARAFYRRQVLPEYVEVFYRTGDLVRLRDDGEYLFLGRKDRQIKTRGHRVELDEVEAALTSRDDVEEAAAFPVPDLEIGNRIEAAVVLAPQAQVEPVELIAHLRARLPPYAVPHSLQVLDAFPRTPTGKIDRPKLRDKAMRKT